MIPNAFGTIVAAGSGGYGFSPFYIENNILKPSVSYRLTSSIPSANLSFVVKKISIIMVLFIFISLSSPKALTFEGPLQVKNQFPLFIYVKAPYLESASIEDSLSASLSYSSIYLVRESPEWSIGLDMEVTELNLRLKKTVKDFLEIGIDIPLVSFNSGFMDGFLNSYHDAFGFPDYGRSNRPDNEFLCEVIRDDILIVGGNGGSLNISDIRLSLKKTILYNDPAISIKGYLEFPAGNAKDSCGKRKF